MRANDLEDVSTAHPFHPFRLVMSDGKSFGVAHPELAVLGRSTVTIETLERPGEQLRCALMHINRIELAARSAPGCTHGRSRH